MEEAERCDRLAILSEGKLVALGTPSDLKNEIGADVILLESAQPQLLADKIAAQFGLAAQVVGDKVRLEKLNGHRFVTEVMEAFPGEIESISASKPNLEDVFIRRTGHRFWSEMQTGEANRPAAKGSAVMATQTKTMPLAAAPPASVGVLLPAASLWQREIVRFYRNRGRVAGVILSPLLFWLVIGSGFATPFVPPDPAAAPTISNSSFPARSP